MRSASLRAGHAAYPLLVVFAAWFAVAGLLQEAPTEPAAESHVLAAAATPAPLFTEVHDYAALACTALITWAVDARAGAPTPQPGVPPATARARLVATYTYLAEATEQLARNLAELGRPQAPGGAAGASLLLDEANNAAAAYRAAEAGAGGLPLGDEFPAAGADLVAATRAAVSEAFTGLPRLGGEQSGSALDEAIAGEAGCARAGDAIAGVR